MNRPTFGPKLAFLSLLLIFLSSCSFLERNTIGLFSSKESPELKPVEDAKVASSEDSAHGSIVQLEKLDQAEVLNKTDVEILWEIPDPSAEEYVIHYGYAPDKLELEVKLSAASIDKIDDPKHGVVYRYILDNQPADKNVYLSMVAVRAGVASAASEVFELKVEK